MEITVRNPGIEETDALRHIWKSVFGTNDEEIFFNNYYFKPSGCIAAGPKNTPVSAGYLLPIGNLLCAGLLIPCAMIYAVATLPEYRRQGYGAAVVQALISAGKAAGFPAVVLCPSGDELFGYYSAKTELREWFYICERDYELPPKGIGQSGLYRVSAEEYSALRNTLLAGKPYIEADMRAIEYQNLLCGLSGGGLYRYESSRGVSCAVVERAPGDMIWVKELLSAGDNESEFVSAVAAEYPGSVYRVRSLARSNNTVCKRFGMLAMPDELCRELDTEGGFPWYGLAYD